MFNNVEMIQLIHIVNNNLLVGLLVISLSISAFAFTNQQISIRRTRSRIPRKGLTISIPANEEKEDHSASATSLYRAMCETPSKVCKQLFARFGLRSQSMSPTSSVKVDKGSFSPAKTFMPFRIEDLLTPTQVKKRKPPFSPVTSKLPARRLIKTEVKRGFMEGLITETLSSLLHDSVSTSDVVQDTFHLALKAIIVELALGFSSSNRTRQESGNEVKSSFSMPSTLHAKSQIPQLSSKVLMYFMWPLFLRSISHTAPAMAMHVSAFELHNVISQF